MERLRELQLQPTHLHILTSETPWYSSEPVSVSFFFDIYTRENHIIWEILNHPRTYHKVQYPLTNMLMDSRTHHSWIWCPISISESFWFWSVSWDLKPSTSFWCTRTCHLDGTRPADHLLCISKFFFSFSSSSPSESVNVGYQTLETHFLFLFLDVNFDFFVCQ